MTFPPYSARRRLRNQGSKRASEDELIDSHMRPTMAPKMTRIETTEPSEWPEHSSRHPDHHQDCSVPNADDWWSKIRKELSQVGEVSEAQKIEELGTIYRPRS